MTKWLRKIATMMQEASESFKLDLSILPEKEEGEEEKGKLSEETIKMFELLHWLSKKIGEEKEAHEKVCISQGRNKCEEFHRRSFTMQRDLDEIKDIFFTSVQEELGLNPYDHPRMAIRKGGVVTTRPSQENGSVEITVVSEMPSGLMTLVESIRKMDEQRRGKPLDS